MNLYYDKDGTKLELLEWAEKFEDHEYRQVALVERDDIMISTVWHGMNTTPYSDLIRPMIFETLVFGGDHDMMQRRYPTFEAALKGHNEVCAEVFGSELNPA